MSSNTITSYIDKCVTKAAFTDDMSFQSYIGTAIIFILFIWVLIVSIIPNKVRKWWLSKRH